jgi:sugar lactone lactonase YvrE
LALFASAQSADGPSRMRAESFVPTGNDLAIEPVKDWPRLPPEINLIKVSGVGGDSRGFVYVANRGDHPLLRLNPDGTLNREIGVGVFQKSRAYNLTGAEPVAMEALFWLHGLYVDQWDNVWITDVGRHLVYKFDPDGVLLLTLGLADESGTDERHFWQPTHVVVDAEGNSYVTDGYGNSRVVKFNADGDYLKAWGVRGGAPGEFYTPHCIALSAAGILHVTDRENDRIQLFDLEGISLGVWPGLHSVDGLCFDREGNLYGAAGLDQCLIRLDTDGRVTNVWRGEFTYVHGVWVDPHGAIYLAETRIPRVWKYRLKDPVKAL